MVGVDILDRGRSTGDPGDVRKKIAKRADGGGEDTKKNKDGDGR